MIKRREFIAGRGSAVAWPTPMVNRRANLTPPERRPILSARQASP
jgi:hypothetical protein